MEVKSEDRRARIVGETRNGVSVSLTRGPRLRGAGVLRTRIGKRGGESSKVVGGGVFRCCVPWCGARTAGADDDYALRDGSPQPEHEQFVAPEAIVNSPRPLGQQSPLPGIEEEDDSDWPLEDATDATLTPSYKSTRSSTDTAYTSSRSSGKKRGFGSPSSVKICVSAAARKSNKARKRGSTTVSASPTGQAGDELPPQSHYVKMQAEQGSIGELQKYHGRYLKSRRHTLANVR
ncbi:unnamed protein product [Leptosia nina]|uniref:Uncharacterized protein n=1 Tax=Leptosia nina TaxID=320188 RepID=A0AAV1JYR8_9NEOP